MNSRKRERRTARPSWKRLKGVFPAPLSWISQRDPPVIPSTSPIEIARPSPYPSPLTPLASGGGGGGLVTRRRVGVGGGGGRGGVSDLSPGIIGEPYTERAYGVAQPPPKPWPTAWVSPAKNRTKRSVDASSCKKQFERYSSVCENDGKRAHASGAVVYTKTHRGVHLAEKKRVCVLRRVSRVSLFSLWPR